MKTSGDHREGQEACAKQPVQSPEFFSLMSSKRLPNNRAVGMSSQEFAHSPINRNASLVNPPQVEVTVCHSGGGLSYFP